MLNKRQKVGLVVVIAVFVLSSLFVAYELITTQTAHNTFDGYCKWRGLTVESKADNYGYCKDPKTNESFKIVLYEGKWYLDGDLPCGFLCF